MLHLCRCKRYTDCEKVEAQAQYNIGILCQWRDPRWCDISQLAQRKWNFRLQRLRPLARHLEDQISAPAKTMQVSQHRVSWKPRRWQREPNLSHETKLRDLQMVKNVHTVLAACLKKQRGAGEAGHTPPCEGRRGRMGHVKLPFGCKATTRTEPQGFKAV